MLGILILSLFLAHRQNSDSEAIHWLIWQWPWVGRFHRKMTNHSPPHLNTFPILNKNTHSTQDPFKANLRIRPNSECYPRPPPPPMSGSVPNVCPWPLSLPVWFFVAPFLMPNPPGELLAPLFLLAEFPRPTFWGVVEIWTSPTPSPGGGGQLAQSGPCPQHKKGSIHVTDSARVGSAGSLLASVPAISFYPSSFRGSGGLNGVCAYFRYVSIIRNLILNNCFWVFFEKSAHLPDVYIQSESNMAQFCLFFSIAITPYFFSQLA